MSNDPFTLDMFGSSALSSGLGLGVTAFGGFSPDVANDDEPDPTPPASAPALPVIAAPLKRPGKLPLGLQLIGPPGGENRLFALAEQLEAAGLIGATTPQ